MKKYFFITIWFILSLQNTLAMTTRPKSVCTWLPGCPSEWQDFTWEDRIDNKWFLNFLDTTIATTIKYVAVIAVIALIISGIYYLTSMWEEEKTSKAKKMIMWSLVWVLLSTSRVFLINMITKFNIN